MADPNVYHPGGGTHAEPVNITKLGASMIPAVWTRAQSQVEFWLLLATSSGQPPSTRTAPTRDDGATSPSNGRCAAALERAGCSG